MTEADILATTYEDRMTVYRPFKEVLENKESIFRNGQNGAKIYEDVECALSSHSGGELQQSASTAKTEVSFCIFTRPEIDILPNDFIVIVHQGKNIEAVAGFPDRQKSHNNVPVRLENTVV